MLAHDSTMAALCDRLLGSSVVGTGNVRYYLRELIGKGGQGWVFKANYDEPDGIWVVVKVLRPDSVNQETYARFRREAEVLRMLGAQATPTPNVVRFYDHGMAPVTFPNDLAGEQQAQVPFTVLEYVDGMTLAQVLEGPPRCALSVERARRVLRQVVRALEAVHAHRVVHRDLKPSNILITDQGNTELVKVTDFGLVKLVDFRMTQTAAVAGASLGYAPPEQYEQGNERVSVRTDVFSLATILFEVLAGREAFPCVDGENPLRVISRILAGPRPSLAASPGSVSRELAGQDDLIAALDQEIAVATQADPDRRHGSCRAFWDVVEPILRTAAERAKARGSAGEMGSGAHERQAIGSPGSPRATPVRATLVMRDGHPAARPVKTGAPSATDLWHPVVTMLSGPVAGLALCDALIGGDGTMMAAGPRGFFRWDGRIWSELPLPAGVEPRAVRGLVRTPSSQILVFGDRGLASVVPPTGVAEPLTSPLIDLCFHGAFCATDGCVVLVGERLSRSCGAVARIDARGAVELHSVERTPRLRSVARLLGGQIVACGDAGALVCVDLPHVTPIPWECTGHLCGVAARPDGGASVVGSGGHALSLGDDLRVVLEAVQTTRDLCATNVGRDGAMWAAGVAGRLLRRGDGGWKRIPVDCVADSRLIVLGLTDSGMIVLGESGVVLDLREAT